MKAPLVFSIAVALSVLPPLAQDGNSTERPPDKSQVVIATCAAFSPDNKYVAVGFGGGSTREIPRRSWLADCVTVWEVATGKQICTLKGHAGGVTFVGFLAESNHVASVGHDSFFRVWNINTHEEINSFGTGVVRGALSADGKRFLGYWVVGRRDFDVWDTKTGKSLNAGRMAKSVYSVVLSPSGDYAFIGAGTLFLWDVARWREIEEFPFERVGPPTAKLGVQVLRLKGYEDPVAFAPDEKHAIIGKPIGEKRHLAVWDLLKRREVRELGDDELWPADVHLSGSGKAACRSREGRLVSWGSDGKENWSARSKDLEHLRFLVFSPDGTLGLANRGGFDVELGHTDQILHIWDLETGKIARRLPRPTRW